LHKQKEMGELGFITKVNYIKKPLSMYEILDMVLSVNIEAIEETLREGSVDKWGFLLENYQSSIDEVKNNANRIKGVYMDIRDDIQGNNYLNITKALSNIPLKWLNTLKYTLYLIEPDLLFQKSHSGVWDLWDLFFSVEENSGMNYVKPLNIKKVWATRLK
jgi:hypothetical protein